MGYDIEKLKNMIEASGIPRKVFFSQIGMSEKTFLGWLNGAVPKESSICKIADKLGVAIAELRPNVKSAETSVVNVADSGTEKRKFGRLTINTSANDAMHLLQECRFNDEELLELRQYSAAIIFDTCSIMNCPDLLYSVRDTELVVVPKKVNDELEEHKVRHCYDDRTIKAQKAITSIFDYRRRYPLQYADSVEALIPQAYRAREGERESIDNKILSVTIRYTKYAGIPVVFITDDKSLSNKASGEGIDVWTAEEFVNSERPRPSAHIDPIQTHAGNNTIDYGAMLSNAEEEKIYNRIIAYSIILRKLNNVKKYNTTKLDEPFKELADLYIFLRTKKNFPQKDKRSFVELIHIISEELNDHEITALSMAFCAAYRDTLSSLSGSIKQIVSDLE